MKVEMTVTISALINGRRYPKAGETLEESDSVCAALIASGYAKPLDKSAPPVIKQEEPTVEPVAQVTPVAPADPAQRQKKKQRR